MRAALARDRGGHARVRVADARDVVVGVEVAAAGGVGDPDALGAQRPRSARRRTAGRSPARTPRRGAPPATGRAARGPAAPSCRATPSQPTDSIVSSIRSADRVVALGPRLLLEPLRDAPGADRDRHRAARRPGDAEHLELDVLEQHAALVAVEDEPGGAEAARRPSRPPHDGVQHRREVGDQRRVAHVAEVDDAGDEPGVVGERVVDGQVGVRDLRAQPRPHRRDAPLERVEHALDDRPRVRVADVVEHRARAQRVLDVPRPSRAARCGCVKPRSACPRRAVVSPHATSAASESSVAAIRLFPGRTS